jgi:hypothetical protein
MTDTASIQIDILKALLDEHRLMIVGRLAVEPQSPARLSENLGLSPRETIRHLSMLDHFGIILKDGHGDTYRLHTESLRTLKKQLFYGGAPAPAETKEEAILTRFVEGDRIKQLPSKLSHRMIILQWLVEEFEPGVDYPERVVNEMLEKHHPDYASLRRAFIDYGFMTRDHGVYRRVPEDRGAGEP